MVRLYLVGRKKEPTTRCIFPYGHPSKYWPCPTGLNFGDFGWQVSTAHTLHTQNQERCCLSRETGSLPGKVSEPLLAGRIEQIVPSGSCPLHNPKSPKLSPVGGVSTWMGDHMGMPRVVGSFFFLSCESVVACCDQSCERVTLQATQPSDTPAAISSAMLSSALWDKLQEMLHREWHRTCVSVNMSGSENEEVESSENFDTPGIIPQNGKRKATSSAIRGRTTKARKWSDLEVDQLVDLLKERICLWDIFSKDYHLRDKKERAYLEMAEKLGIAVVDIKAKIIGLQAQLGREIAKTKSTKSGQAVTDSYKSNWIYSEKLQFLAAVMQAGKKQRQFATKSTTRFWRVTWEPARPCGEFVRWWWEQSKTKTARKCDTELKKQELLLTCIQVLREPIMPSPQAPESAFSILLRSCHSLIEGHAW